MRYLPILQELFESDTIVFFIIGLGAALAAGIRFRSLKKSVTGLAGSLLIYVVCEIVENQHKSYLVQIIALFIGTAAIGGLIGFLTGFLFALCPALGEKQADEVLTEKVKRKNKKEQ